MPLTVIAQICFLDAEPIVPSKFAQSKLTVYSCLVFNNVYHFNVILYNLKQNILPLIKMQSVDGWMDGWTDGWVGGHVGGQVDQLVSWWLIIAQIQNKTKNT